VRILEGLAGLRQLPAGRVISIGNFDGVHRGHQHLLNQARSIVSQRSASGLTLVTFEPHPLTVIRPALAPPRLTSAAIKQQLLADAHVDDLVVLAPTPEVLNLTAEIFWQVLRDEVKPKALIEGRSFTFGKNRGGTVEDLRRWSVGTGVSVEIAEPMEIALLNCQIVPISSSLIRWLLANGRVRDAAICLGRGYVLQGPVIRGHQRGRQLGVPTANLHCPEQLIPADGIYAARTNITGQTFPTALSIGTMPTFGENDRQIEAHLIGFDGDLYGQNLSVEIVDWLRDQQKYPNVDALLAQIAEDVRFTSERFVHDPSVTFAHC
jgi:riboflavin kinase/FMN adenylyltransferase